MTISTNLILAPDKIASGCRPGYCIKGTGPCQQIGTYQVDNDEEYIDYHLLETHQGEYKINLQVLSGRINNTYQTNNSLQMGGNAGVEGSYSILKNIRLSGGVNSDQSETTTLFVENNHAQLIQIMVSGGKRGNCCFGEDSSYILYLIVGPKNRSSSPITASLLSAEVRNVDSLHPSVTSAIAVNSSSHSNTFLLELLKQKSENGVYLAAKCMNRQCKSYSMMELIYGGIVSTPYSVNKKIYTTACPCCSVPGKIDVQGIGLKGLNWKWEGKKQVQDQSQLEERTWVNGSVVKDAIIDLTATKWEYLEIICCK